MRLYAPILSSFGYPDVIPYNFSIVLFFFVCIYYMMSKAVLDKKKEAYEVESRLGAKLHDELSNQIQSIITFNLTAEPSLLNRALLHTKLEEIYTISRNISREHLPIDTGITFSNELHRCILDYQNPGLTINIHGIDEIDWKMVSETKKIDVYRIIQELFVNMRKHSNNSVAWISVMIISKNLHIKYSDNGTSYGKNGKTMKSGLRLAEKRISNNRGKVNYDNKNGSGFKVHFSFPI